MLRRLDINRTEIKGNPLNQRALCSQNLQTSHWFCVGQQGISVTCVAPKG